MNTNDSTFVNIVSGLPRSGTSMMMQMLHAGGMPILTDRLRAADQDNLKGYYEFEPVKRSKHDPSWVQDAEGKAVKAIYALLADLPPDYRYRVVFMRRELAEVVRSQEAMLWRRNEQGADLSTAAMTGVFQRQLDKIDAWLAQQPNIDALDVKYRLVIDDPLTQARRVGAFLDANLDVEAMAGVVEPAMYRQRTS